MTKGTYKIEKSYDYRAKWVVLVSAGNLIESHDAAIGRGRGFDTKKAAQEYIQNELRTRG